MEGAWFFESLKRGQLWATPIINFLWINFCCVKLLIVYDLSVASLNFPALLKSLIELKNIEIDKDLDTVRVEF